MEPYGGTLRQFRKQKGYTIAELAKGIVSVSFLSKFERGESEISLSHFHKMLGKLSLSFEEFFFVHNQYIQDAFEVFFNSADDAYHSRDLSALNELKVAEKQKWEELGLETARCNLAMLEVFESILQDQEIKVGKEEFDFLCQYFFKVEVWGYYELRLYNSTILLLPPQLVITLSKTAYVKSHRFKELPKNHKAIVSILMNTLIYLIGGQFTHSYIQHYETFKSYLVSMGIKEQDLFTKSYLLFIEGIYQIKTGNREEGIEQAESSLSILEKLDAPNIAFGLRTYLDLILKYTA
ncbi:helix-turn-helix domain-containing protein [Planococcus sp. X10-3]|uniref:helix-turn-helix domain-containing protein n=1 Tax=Planococcus sp. X10-3 TaxID=3061240 RepID=UPI003BB176FA